MYVCMYVYIYTNVYAHVYGHVYVYVYTYNNMKYNIIYIYMWGYIYIYICKSSRSPVRRAVHTAMPSLDISPFLSGSSRVLGVCCGTAEVKGYLRNSSCWFFLRLLCILSPEWCCLSQGTGS